jgi:hypothetical protein
MVDGALSFDDVGWLLDGLEHSAPAVRAASLEALVRLPLDRSVRLTLAERVDLGLRTLVGGASPDDAAALVDAAPYVATPDVRVALAAVAARAPGNVRVPAVFALAAAGDPAAVPGLATLLEGGEEGQRAAAAESLVRLIGGDGREAVGQARAALAAARGDADVQVRFWAALGLARRGELEPMRAVLADVDAGEPFPPLFGDPQRFLGRLTPIRKWPEQERQAIASLAADANLSDAGRTLADLLQEAAMEAALGVGFDPDALPRASAALDDMVGELRRAVGPLPPRPGEAEGMHTRDVIELMDYARHAPDPMAGLELGNRIVSLVAAIGPVFDTDADAGARVYMEWDRTGPALPQIAWVLSRAGAAPALAALGRHVRPDVDDEVRLRAVQGALDVARALPAGPPILGGGDITDVPPDPGALADAPRVHRLPRV